MIMIRFQHPKGKNKNKNNVVWGGGGGKILLALKWCVWGKRQRSHKIWKIMGCSYVIILNRVSMLYIGDVKK